MSNGVRREGCPYCKSDHYVMNGRNGVPEGKQTYLCNDCTKRWKSRWAVGGRSFPPDQIGTGIQKYYTGLSFRGAAKAVKEQFGLEDTDISPQTIRNWVHRYTDVAVELTRGHKAVGGGTWWLCSQPFGLYPRMWWMVLDETTGYILATHIVTSTTQDGVWKVLLEALASAVRPCDEVAYMKAWPEFWSAGEDIPNETVLEVIQETLPLASHIDPSMNQEGVRKVLLEALASAVRPCDEVAYMKAWPEFWSAYEGIPNETVLKVIQEIFPDQEVIEEIEGIASFPSGSVAARILAVYEATHKRFERIRNDDDCRRYIAGWVITSNLFTEHRERGGRTPGQAAGVKVPVADWADVVRLEAQAYLPNADT